MKLKTYLFTYFAYVLNHALRMSLSYNKAHLKDVFNVNSLELGIFDALIYITYGIGAIFRFSFFGDRNLTKMYLISALMISCFFVIIPFVSIFNQNLLLESKINGKTIFFFDFLLLISFMGYGFFHLAVWQIMVTLMSKQWHATKDGTKMGFWATNSSIGNILGFLLSNLIVQKLKLPWETSMIFFAILNLFVALLMYFMLQNPGQKPQIASIKQNNANSQSLDQNEQEITTSQFIEYSKWKFMSFVDFRLFIFSYIAMKAAVYSYLMWYPIYLYSEGFQNVSGYISMLFDFASIFGSTFIGRLSQYEKQILHRNKMESQLNPANNSCFDRIVLLRFCLSIAMAFILVLLYFIVPSSLASFCILTILLGLTIGGTFQVYSSSNMMLYGEQKPRNVDIISNFSIVIGCLFTGFFQLIIGLITNDHKDEKNNQGFKNFFYVLLFLIVFCGILLVLRATIWKPTYYENTVQRLKKDLGSQEIQQYGDNVQQK